MPSPPDHRAGNLIGIAAMLGAMAAFVANDTCVKLIGDAIPLGELILLRSLGATALVVSYAYAAGGFVLPSPQHWPLITWRVAADVLATLCIVAGVLGLPIADATAISQVTPLAMTATAAIVLKEAVGWRRWTAIIVGFIGVVLIVRPGTATFSLPALLVLGGVVFVVARDLITRRISSDVATLTLLGISLAGSSIAGIVLYPFETWTMPDRRVLLLLGYASVFVATAYTLIIIAMRNGDVATVSPFRYGVIVFALISGYVFWNELPDKIQLVGIAILTLAGIYTFHRERLSSANK